MVRKRHIQLEFSILASRSNAFIAKTRTMRQKTVQIVRLLFATIVKRLDIEDVNARLENAVTAVRAMVMSQQTVLDQFVVIQK